MKLRGESELTLVIEKIIENSSKLEGFTKRKKFYGINNSKVLIYIFRKNWFNS
jgi:hypothetical protein